jgi:hypothetical protein
MTLRLSCSCGQTHWTVTAPRAGQRITCYCADCQTAARHLKADVLDPGGGTEILQVAAHQLSIAGPPHALLRLSPRGLFRWHTSCCDTPIANTLPFPHLSFAGVLLANLREGADALPRSTGMVNTVYARGRPGVPERDQGLGRSVLGVFKRALAARLSGKWRETPFFTGPPWTPVATPQVLSREARHAARP